MPEIRASHVSGQGITIAIPFFRRLDYLADAIASVRAQSSPAWDLWIADDSGTRDAEALVLAAAASDSRIHYHANPRNLGMARNWNECIDRAESDLITLLHADDRLLPGYVEAMLAASSRQPTAGAFFCPAEIIGPDGERRASLADTVKKLVQPNQADDHVLEGEPGLRAVMAANYIMCPSLCFRRSRIGTRRFDPQWKQVQDLDFIAGLLFDGRALVGISETAYAYRRHDENATSTQSESLLRFEEELLVFGRVAASAVERGWSGASRTAQRARVVLLHLAYRVLRDVATACPAAALQKCRFLWQHRRGAIRADSD